MKKAKLIGLATGAAVLIIGAAFIIGNRFFKTNDPKIAVISAFAKTLGEVKQPEDKFSTLLAQLYGGGFKQDVTIGINKLGGSLLPLEPSALSVAEVLTLKNTTRRDAEASAVENTLTAQFAVTPLADVQLYGNRDVMAVSVPQAYDYFITLNPRQIASEWDASLLGVYVTPVGGMIAEGPFYEYYQRILFTKPNPTEETAAFIRHVGLLDEDTEYIYDGKDKDRTIYRVNIPEASLNAYWQAVNPAQHFAGGFPDDLIGEWLTGVTDTVGSLRFEGGATARVYVLEGKVSEVELTARPVISGKAWDMETVISLNGNNVSLEDVAVRVRLSSGANAYVLSIPSWRSCAGNPAVYYNAAVASFGEEDAETTTQLSWNISWDNTVKTSDNFTLSAEWQDAEQNRIALDMNGQLTADYNNGHIDANMKKLTLALAIPEGTLEASVNAKYVLVHDDGEVTYNKSNEVPLTRVTEFDALAMRVRLMADPALGRLLQGVLP